MGRPIITAVRVRSGVAVRDGRVVWAASLGRCHCRAKLRQLGVPLPGGACDVGGDDVGGVPVQAAAGPVVPHRGSRVSM